MDAMRTYDITLTLSPDLPVWPGDPIMELERVAKMEDGEHNNVSRLAMSVHMGTHVDAPYHFLADGKKVDQLPLKILMGRAYVAYLPDVESITAAEVERAEIPPRTRRVLFKTRNSTFWAQGISAFQTDYVALTPDAAASLIKKGVKLVGVDYLSVAPYGDSVPTHRVLLEAGVVVLEGVNLSAVSQGRYTLYCLPLKIAADGAPARAVLVGV
jgi:arylformamidase